MVGGFGPAAPELFDMIVANLVRCVDKCPQTSRPGCTCATATTDTSIFVSPTRWDYRSGY